MNARPSSHTIQIPLGVLVWTPDGPRPVETLQAGEALTGFDPTLFARTSVGLERVQVQSQQQGRLISVGGRIVACAALQTCLAYTLNGAWNSVRANTVQTGNLLSVDRVTPTPAMPTALPAIDDDLTPQLQEDALALLDALHDSDKYFHEMDKRAQRLALYELLGYLCGAARITANSLTYTAATATLTDHYTATFRTLFGATPQEDAQLLHRLRRWLGDGLAPPAQRALPPWVWHLPTPACNAFLRGFFDTADDMSETEIVIVHPALSLLVGVQTLLGRVHLESMLTCEKGAYRLTIQNVRRFAEWINTNVTAHAGLLHHVYHREPRYPSESTALLPLNIVRPALARIRAAHPLPRRSTDTVDDQEVARVENLRLLATAFHDAGLRDHVNQQLYLEPVTDVHSTVFDTVFILSVSSCATVVTNGVVLGAPTP